MIVSGTKGEHISIRQVCFNVYLVEVFITVSVPVVFYKFGSESVDGDTLPYIAVKLLMPLIKGSDVIFVLVKRVVVSTVMPVLFLITKISTITALFATIVDFCYFGIYSL